MNKLVWHQVFLFAVLAMLTVVRILVRGWAWENIWLWWWLGGVIGFVFVFLDRLVGSVVNTQQINSMKLREAFGRGRVIRALAGAFAERGEQKKLVMRSVLFVAIWAVLTLFTATSVASGFARGFVLGIGTHVIFDLVWDYFLEKERLDNWFWQTKNVTEREKAGFVWVSIGFYLTTVWFL